MWSPLQQWRCKLFQSSRAISLNCLSTSISERWLLGKLEQFASGEGWPRAYLPIVCTSASAQATILGEQSTRIWLTRPCSSTSSKICS